MRQAMKLVRDELGADAAIIGNRRIAGGVELTAALDYKLSALAPRVPNMELEDELRKTQSRIVTAQAELSLRGDGESDIGTESSIVRRLAVDRCRAVDRTDVCRTPSSCTRCSASVERCGTAGIGLHAFRTQQLA